MKKKPQGAGILVNPSTSRGQVASQRIPCVHRKFSPSPGGHPVQRPGGETDVDAPWEVLFPVGRTSGFLRLTWAVETASCGEPGFLGLTSAVKVGGQGQAITWASL